MSSGTVSMSFKKLAACAASITGSLQRQNETGECVSVDFGHRHRGTDREARLPTKYFNPCFSLCLPDLILRHKRSDLMLDGNRRWKTEFASEPKGVHLRLLSQSGGMNSPSSFHGGVKLLHRWGASGISQENRHRSYDTLVA